MPPYSVSLSVLYDDFHTYCSLSFLMFNADFKKAVFGLSLAYLLLLWGITGVWISTLGADLRPIRVTEFTQILFHLAFYIS